MSCIITSWTNCPIRYAEKTLEYHMGSLILLLPNTASLVCSQERPLVAQPLLLCEFYSPQEPSEGCPNTSEAEKWRVCRNNRLKLSGCELGWQLGLWVCSLIPAFSFLGSVLEPILPNCVVRMSEFSGRIQTSSCMEEKLWHIGSSLPPFSPGVTWLLLVGKQIIKPTTQSS